jgi:hypothetical protein
MHARTVATAFLFTSTLLATAAHARPFRTDAAGTTAPANVEIEVGSDWWTDQASFGLNIKQGLTSRMDLGFYVPYAAFPDSTRAYGNAKVSAKFDLVPSLASVAFTSELGSGNYVLNGALTKAWGPLKASVDLGGHFTAGAREADLSWGVNPSYSVGPATMGAELRGSQHEANWWQVGAGYKLADGIAVDAGLGDDFSDGHNWHVATGIWIALPSIK